MQDSYPRAIVHVDGDAFFASVEQALDWRLKGKPVVTGAERGAATSISYEAKRLGVRRGMTMGEIRRACPDVIVVPGNYTAYSLFARRMYTIVRSFTPFVEEYSIDECFADITGYDRVLEHSYEQIALLIKDRLERELGVTFGVGLAPTKTLAKVASKFRKPSGFTAIPRTDINAYLSQIPTSSVWGLGGVSGLRLEKMGCSTADLFAAKEEGWLASEKLTKPLREIWAELRGISVRPLSVGEGDPIGSVIKTHTFRPTRDRELVLSELSKNIEAACAKVRGAGMQARVASFYLKTQDFSYQTMECLLPAALSEPREVVRVLGERFDAVFEQGVEYRATGVTLRALVPAASVTSDLFGRQQALDERSGALLEAVDTLNHRYGRSTVFLGSSMQAHLRPERAAKSRRLSLGIEARKKTLEIPYLGVAR